MGIGKKRELGLGIGTGSWDLGLGFGIGLGLGFGVGLGLWIGIADRGWVGSVGVGIMKVWDYGGNRVLGEGEVWEGVGGW